MMRKTPIRRLVKRLPLESMPNVARLAVLDEEGDVIEGEAVEVKVPAARANAAAYVLARGGNGEESEPQGTAETATESVAPDVGCGSMSPHELNVFCVKPAGHDLTHRAADDSTWR
jgi:hypothetical protein